MQSGVLSVLVLTLLTGCSGERKLQGEVYRSLSRNLSLPEESEARGVFSADLKTVARLSGEAVVMSSELHAVPIRKEDSAFYDSVIFMRTTLFTVSRPGDRIMKEEIYAFVGERPVTLKRQVFDAIERKTIFTEVFPDAAPH